MVQALVQSKPSRRTTRSQHAQTSKTKKQTGKVIKKHTNKGHALNIRDFKNLNGKMMYLVQRDGSKQDEWETEDMVDDPHVLVRYQRKVQEESGYSIDESAEAITTKRPSRSSKIRAVMAIKEVASVDDNEEKEETGNNRGTKRKSAKVNLDGSVNKRSGKGERKTKAQIQLEQQLEERMKARLARKKLDGDAIVHSLNHFEGKDCCLMCASNTYREKLEKQDLNGFKAAFQDYKSIPNFSEEDARNGLGLISYAIVLGKYDFAEYAVKKLKNSKTIHKKPNVPQKYKVYDDNTGSNRGGGYYNNRNFREVQESRGNRLGNSAFYRENNGSYSKRSFMNVDDKTSSCCLRPYMTFISKDVFKNEDAINSLLAFENCGSYEFYFAVNSGNRFLASKILAHVTEKQGKTTFNHLHDEVLKLDAEEPLSNYKRPQILKFASDANNVTPYHCAAIHPDSTYLTEFYDNLDAAERLETDSYGRSVAFYAAVSETSACLEFLISKGFNMTLHDRYKITPLMQAARFGRSHNVKRLAKYLNGDTEDSHVSTTIFQSLVRNKRTALHYAAYFGHAKTCRVLIELGAPVESLESLDKQTPLHFAAKNGYLDCVKVLMEEGDASPEKGDKFSRNALHLACIYGHLDIVYYLLSQGVDANASDSSQNSPAHYAAAYGYLNILHLLIQYGGANPSISNVWRSTPCSVANMKGHLAIVKYLLELPGNPIDVNFKDQDGFIMLQRTINESVTSLLEMKMNINKVKLLLSMNANTNSADISGCTSLHTLANNTTYIALYPKGWKSFYPTKHQGYHYAARLNKGTEMDDRDGINYQVKLAKLLIENGADLHTKNFKKQTPLCCAMSSNNHFLVAVLIEAGSSFWIDTDGDGKNFFHYFGDLLAQANSFQPHNETDTIRQRSFLEATEKVWTAIVSKLTPKTDFSLTINACDKDGYPPLAYGLKRAIEEQKASLRNEKRLIFCAAAKATNCEDKLDENNQRWVLPEAYADLTEPLSIDLTMNFLVYLQYMEKLMAIFEPDVNAVIELPKDFKKNNPKVKKSNYPKATGETVLHLASQLQDLSLVQFFLKHGAEPNQKVNIEGTLGDTPLLIAYHRKKDDEQQMPEKRMEATEFINNNFIIKKPNFKTNLRQVVKIMLEYGCSPFDTNSIGNSTLLKASAKLDLINLKLMCQSKPSGNEDINTENEKNQTALMVAVITLEKLIRRNKTFDASVVELLLQSNANPNVSFENGDTVLMKAIGMYCFPLVKTILEKAIVAFEHNHQNKSLETALGFALRLNEQHIVSMYLQYLKNDAEGDKLNPNIFDALWRTPIFHACRHGNLDAVKTLIALGANPNIYKPASVPFIEAVKSCNLELIEFLLNNGADVHVCDHEGNSPLHAAVLTGKYRIVDLLLKYSADCSFTNTRKQTPLHLAVEVTKKQTNRSFKIERSLIKMGANINALDFFGRTPLHYVFVSCELIPITCNTTIIQKKVKQIIKEFETEVRKEDELKNYAYKFDLGDDSNNSTNPLATVNAWMKKAKKMQLEEKHPFENARKQFTNNITIDEDEKERLKLYRAYKFESNTITPERFDPIDILKFISGYKEVQFDIKDEFGRTPLHYAACVGAFSCTSILIERQVDINALDIDNNGTLQLALRNNHIDYSVMLCNFGASVKRDIVLQNGNSISTFGFSLSKSLTNIAYIIMERSSLLIESIRDALKNGKFHLVEILLQSADDHALCQVLEKEDQNIWHIIADFKPFNNEMWQDYLQDIILRISSLNLRVYSDKFGRSPLHYAAMHGQDVLLKHLTSIQRVNCYNQDEEGKTELDYAVESCNIQCVKIILEQGAKTSRVSGTKHKSVLLRSVEERQFEIAELLLQNGAPTDDGDSANGWPNAVMVACQQNNINMLKLLIQHGADLDTPSQIERKDKNQQAFKVLIHPIFIASFAGDLFLETLLQGGANPNVYGPNHEPENGQSCFMFNVSLGRVKNQMILLNYNIDLNMFDHQTSRTIFYWFFFQKIGLPKKKYSRIDNYHLDISVYNKMLHSYQPQVNHIDTATGMTPLELAIYQKSLIVVERLLALGADVNMESCSEFVENVMNPHKTKLPAVLHAILVNKLEIVKLVCERATQSINYLWQDNKGNNMLSYVLGIVNDYSYCNITILHYIANQMTSVNVEKLLRMKDVHGVPLALYAYHRSNKGLYTTLLSLDPTLEDFVSENYRSSDFDFKNHPSPMPVDYIPTTKVDEDAQIERAKLQHAKNIENDKRQEKDELFKVDSYSKLERVGEIVLDENDIPYNIMLMKVELNSWGTYTDTSFYKLSIIYNKVLDVYILWTRWGPFSKEGQHQKTPYLTKEEAVQEFKAIFKAKTGNVWDDHRTSFTIKPGRYEIMQKAQHPKDTIIEDFDFLKSDKPTQLSTEVLNLMKLICNYEYLSRVYSSTRIDMPLGQIPQKRIEEARGILSEVKELINTYRGLKNCYSDKAKLLESKIYAFKIAQKCIAYSRLLPRSGDAYNGIRSLYGNGDNLKKELSNLEGLSYVSFAANVLLAAKHHYSEINPLEYAFRTLNCNLRPLSLDAQLQEYAMITRYMKSTCKEDYDLVHLFAVNRADEEIRFRPFENELDRKLLWHGSRIGNFMGILKQGLRASPHTSSSNGALLGNGVYFADTFTKALGYSNDTYGQSSSPFRIMLLCEVALGSNQGKMNQTPFKEYEMHDSVKGEGANIPDPLNALYDSKGVCIPLGPCIPNTNIQVTDSYGFNNVPLNYNEYAVYNEDRIKIRYLLILREKYNCHLCAKPRPSESLRPFFRHKLSKYKYTGFNIYEAEVVKAYLYHQGKSPQDIFSQDLNEFIEKKIYKTKWDTPLDLQPDSKICTKCAMITTTMMLERRMVDNRDRLDVLDILSQKPRCKYGKECKSQQSIHHTKKYKHWSFDKLTDDINDTQEEELTNADNEHIIALDE